MGLSRQAIKSSLIVLSLLILGGVLGRVLYVTMTVRGLRAEARLMLSYLHTLQKVQSMESDKYIGFSSFYGAPISGKDNCSQPEGAARLGFLLKWCHTESPSPLRYSYRLTLSEDNYKAEAHAGSDHSGASFVCFGHQEEDIWVVDKKKQIQRVKSCRSTF